jgi:hypothetical protein
MESGKSEMLGKLYNQQFSLVMKKKTIDTRETTNESLPNIQQNKSKEKANYVRNELNDTKSQVLLMEAKLKSLRKIK